MLRLGASSPSKIWILFTVSLLLLTGLFQAATVERIERPEQDSSTYLKLAENLLNFGAYEFNFAPHRAYPPGFPALIAFAIRLTGRTSHEFLVRFMPLMASAGLVFWYFVGRRAYGVKTASAAVLLTASSPAVYEHATRYLMADIPYMAISGLACWMLLARPRARTGLLMSATAVACSAFAVLTRSAGVCLGAASIAWAILPPAATAPSAQALRRRALLAGSACLLAFAIWVQSSRGAAPLPQTGGHMTSYFMQFQYKTPHSPDLGHAGLPDYLVRIKDQAIFQAANLSAIVLRMPWVQPVWYSPLVLLPVALVAAGLAVSWRHWRQRLLGLYVMAYFGVYLLWPFSEGPRFTIPAAVPTLLILWAGAREILRRISLYPAFAAGVLCTFSAGAFLTARWGGVELSRQAAFSLLFWPLAALAASLAGGHSRRTVALGSRRRIRVPWNWKAVNSTILVLLVLGGFWGQAKMAAQNIHPEPASHPNGYVREVSKWLSHAKPGSVMAGDFAIIHRFTGRLTVFFPPTAHVDQILQAIRDYKVRYLIVRDAARHPYFLPDEPARVGLLMERARGLLRPVHRGKGFTIYEVAGGESPRHLSRSGCMFDFFGIGWAFRPVARQRPNALQSSA